MTPSSDFPDEGASAVREKLGIILRKIGAGAQYYLDTRRKCPGGWFCGAVAPPDHPSRVSSATILNVDRAGHRGDHACGAGNPKAQPSVTLTLSSHGTRYSPAQRSFMYV